MKKVILSIKPEYAHKIFDGSKHYEFRKAIFKSPEVKKVIVYASYPISKVIGEFDIESIIHDDIESLWKLTSEFSGITEDFFNTYFSEREKGYAIKVKNPKKYKNPKILKDEFNIPPPQSFAYVLS